MMLCLNIMMTTTMNGFIENTNFEYVDGANKTDCHLSICGRPPKIDPLWSPSYDRTLVAALLFSSRIADSCTAGVGIGFCNFNLNIHSIFTCFPFAF